MHKAGPGPFFVVCVCVCVCVCVQHLPLSFFWVSRVILLHWLCSHSKTSKRNAPLLQISLWEGFVLSSLQLEVLWCLDDDVHVWPRFVKGCVVSLGTSATYLAYYINTFLCF